MISDTTQSESITPAKPKAVHLPFLDGMRGIAALWVLFGHIVGSYETILTERYSAADVENFHLYLTPFRWLHQPGDAVTVFIVLSGFCLALPIMRDGNFRLRGSMAEYIKRRAWRILPGYYATFLLAVVLIVAARFVKRGGGFGDFDMVAYQTNINPGSIISHLLLIHNWNPTWSASVLNVLWTVALEWQIYFLLPLFLLPLWRKVVPHGTGTAALTTVIVALAVGMIPTFFLPATYNLTWFRPWLLGIFAMGVAGAWIFTGKDAASQRMQNVSPAWGLLPLLLLIVLRYFVIVDERLSDVLIAIVAVALMLAFQRSAGKPWWGSAVLENKVVLWFGTISYSLYLTHALILPRIATILYRFTLSAAAFGFVLFISTALTAFLVAFIFYLLFEKPFLAIRQRSGSAAPVSAVQPA